jgi:hypothetical protein
MPKEIKQISVLCSCPSEMNDEKIALKEAARDLTIKLGNLLGYTINIIDWKEVGRPNAGPEPQRHLNRTIGDEYDIYVGILGSRFGTPTANFGSGTEEEFDLAIKRNRSQQNVDVMLYFRDPRSSPGNIDAEQLVQVQRFQNKLRSEGITYWEYTTVEEFQRQVSLHLTKCIQDVLSDKIPTSSEHAMPDLGGSPIAYSPLANLELAETDDDDDVSLFELAETVEQEFLAANERIKEVGSAIEMLGGRIIRGTKLLQEVGSADSAAKRKKALAVIGGISTAFDNYTADLESVIPSIHRHFSIAMNSIVELIIIGRASAAPDDSGALEEVERLRDTMLSASSEISRFISSMADLPNFEKRFNKSRKRAVAVSKDLMAFVDDTILQLGRLELK